MSPNLKIKTMPTNCAQTFLLANSTNSGKAFDYFKKQHKYIAERRFKNSKIRRKINRSIMLRNYAQPLSFLVKEIKRKRITDFIKKCNTSIAKYINTKTGRKGPLFGKQI